MKIKLILLLLIPIIGVSQTDGVVENTYSSVLVYTDSLNLLRGTTTIKYNFPENGWISTFTNKSQQFELKPIGESFVAEIEFYGETRTVLINNFIDTKKISDLKIKVVVMLDKPERAEVHFYIYDDEGNFQPMQSLMSEEYVKEYINKNRTE